MKHEIAQQLQDAAQRLTQKGLFGLQDDRFSMKIPGSDEMVWLQNPQGHAQTSRLPDARAELVAHAEVYRIRADAGAVLISTTTWSEQLAAIAQCPPTLFDEQARHIGPIAAPVAAGDLEGLSHAIRQGSNIALYGSQCLRIGMTRDRVVFNAELFEKCAMAYVIAYTAGRQPKTIPAWVRYIAGRRLRKDQRRAAASYAQGKIPPGMNAY